MTKHLILYPFYNFGRQTDVFRNNRFLLQQYVTFVNRIFRPVPRVGLLSMTSTTHGIIPKQNLNCREDRSTLISKAYFHDDSESDSDSEELLENRSMPTVDPYEQLTAANRNTFRHLLNPEPDDVVIQKLNACVSVQEVFNVIREYKTSMTAYQTSQAVLVLSNIQKFFCRANTNISQNSSTVSHIPDKCGFIYELNRHEDFVTLLQLVEKIHEDLSADVSACVLLYLQRMVVNLKHPTIQKLITRCTELVNRVGEEFPLTALSRFTVTLTSRQEMRMWTTILIGQHFLPAILNTIDHCKDAEDFKLLTICLNSIHSLIQISTLEAYKKKAEELVDLKLINENTSGTIIKAILFLNHSHWSSQNIDTIRRLMLILQGHISKLPPKYLIHLHKVFQDQLEPADILEEMQKHGRFIFSRAEHEDLLLSKKETINLLSCLVHFSPPLQKKSFEELAKHLIEDRSPTEMFYVLRNLKTSNVQLCDQFWSTTLATFEGNINSNGDDFRLFRMCRRYMNFHNNITASYRNYAFESKSKDWLLESMRSGISGLIPSKFALVASFLIAYSDKNNSPTFEEDLTNKVVEMVPQFKTNDCVIISRGLRLSSNLQQVQNMSPSYIDNFVAINRAMNDFTEGQLRKSETSFTDVNMLMRAYLNRKGPNGTELCSHLLERIRTSRSPLTSRLIRDVVSNLQARHFLVPEMVERMVDYVIANDRHLLGDTAEKLLHHCYNVGYTSVQADVFLPIVADLILRDKERLSGLALIQGALALCFFQRLPATLIDELFTVEFLERLDDEILTCYSKVTYPYLIRRTLMELNRAVCLDYPDADVPWFHKKFCEEMVASEGLQESSFYNDVLKSLVNVVGSKELISTRVYSPYFYKIDFQIALNDKNNPVRLDRQSDANANLSRVAILLYKTEDYCSNVNTLVGHQLLKRRHLEILGFRVVGISSTRWHSMYMAEPMAKHNYLHERIWPTVVR